MKIAVSSMEPDLDSQIDPRFGRCQYFIMVDSETMEFEVIQNPNMLTTGGAGIHSAQLIANKGAEIILTGNCGPNAFQTLSAVGVKVIVGVLGAVREAIEKYKRGELQPASGPSLAGNLGMDPGFGRSPLTGRGPGMGRGRGLGRRMMGGSMDPTSFQSPAPDQEIQILKDQSQMLAQQLEQIQKRIEELDEKK